MSKQPPKGPPPLSGRALRAAVAAAEATLTGDVVKQTFFRQLGLDQLDALDLRVGRPQPWTQPALASDDDAEQEP